MNLAETSERIRVCFIISRQGQSDRAKNAKFTVSGTKMRCDHSGTREFRARNASTLHRPPISPSWLVNFLQRAAESQHCGSVVYQRVCVASARLLGRSSAETLFNEVAFGSRAETLIHIESIRLAACKLSQLLMAGGLGRGRGSYSIDSFLLGEITPPPHTHTSCSLS